MKGPASGLSQQAGEAEGSLILEVQGRVGSSPDNDEAGRHSQTVRARQAKREGVREEPASESLSIECTGSNLGMRAGIAVHACLLRRTGDSFGRYLSRRPGGHIEGLRRRCGDAPGA